MSDHDLVIQNARVPVAARVPCGGTGTVSPADDVEVLDVAVSAGEIAALGTGLTGATTVDAAGRLLLPGLIDNHVHYREPGATLKEGYVTGTAASARGGATTVGEIQNNAPLIETAEQWRAKVDSVRARSRVRTLVYGCAIRASLPHLRAVAAEAPAIKLFMAADGDLELNHEDELRAAFQAVAAAEGLMILHAEDGDLVRKGIEQYGDDPAQYWQARPIEAERLAIERAVNLAREVGTRLHIFHVSSGAACEEIRAARAEGLFVSASICPHYLLYTDRDVAERGAVLKCNPSIKTGADREALREALRDGTLDVFSSDHAPHPVAQKQKSFREAPSGIPGADLLLPLLMHLVDEEVVSLGQAVQRACLAPAVLFDLPDRGRIAEGAAADLVLVDVEERTVDGSMFASKGTFSPYVGRTLRHWPAVVWVGGRPVYTHGEDEDLIELERTAPPPLSGGNADSVCC